jgi:hypothetical protein
MSKRWAQQGKGEEVEAGRWMRIARRVRWRCCRCGLAHTHHYRVRRNGGLEVKVT